MLPRKASVKPRLDLMDDYRTTSGKAGILIPKTFTFNLIQINKETKPMETQNVIMEFCEKQQQFHLHYHTVKENTNGYQTLQILENPDEAHFICEFLENILQAKGGIVTFEEMKLFSNEAIRLLRNYN